MASTNKTSLGLNQWTESDKPHMDDFNKDNTILNSELGDRYTKIQIQNGVPKITIRHSNQQAYTTLSHHDADSLTRIYCTDGTSNVTTYINPANGSIWNNQNGKGSLGVASYKYATAYLASGVSTASDRNEKENIHILDGEEAAEFILALAPVSYRYKNGTSGRTHFGLIAQDVEQCMEDVGLSDMDFAGLIKYEDEEAPGKVGYALRYEEFIAPLIATVQQQQSTIADLQERLEALEKK